MCSKSLIELDEETPKKVQIVLVPNPGGDNYGNDRFLFI